VFAKVKREYRNIEEYIKELVKDEWFKDKLAWP